MRTRQNYLHNACIKQGLSHGNTNHYSAKSESELVKYLIPYSAQSEHRHSFWWHIFSLLSLHSISAPNRKMCSQHCFNCSSSQNVAKRPSAGTLSPQVWESRQTNKHTAKCNTKENLVIFDICVLFPQQHIDISLFWDCIVIHQAWDRCFPCTNIGSVNIILKHNV